ncbi:MAG: hypothetical protein HOJ16_00100 [Candidatus Peribacter sp.]|nr:hypothetical protein [Candidatus Peribacter sp.]
MNRIRRPASNQCNQRKATKMTLEEIQQRLVDSARMAIFDELKEMRLSKAEASRAVRAVATHHEIGFGGFFVALDEYISYCEAVEIE